MIFYFLILRHYIIQCQTILYRCKNIASFPAEIKNNSLENKSRLVPPVILAGINRQASKTDIIEATD